ncbi:MAG: hypothetical protein IJH91_04320 [Mogibacterium sp.]|nr:hypothetical protein [Mogibacterium sp.]
MAKFVTRDNKSIKIKLAHKNDELMNLLNNTVPRLSYDEILEGELEKRMKDFGVNIESIELSCGDDIKELLLSKAIFDALSKPTGV